MTDASLVGDPWFYGEWCHACDRFAKRPDGAPWRAPMCRRNDPHTEVVHPTTVYQPCTCPCHNLGGATS